jgi:hypothetical protein
MSNEQISMLALQPSLRQVTKHVPSRIASHMMKHSLLAATLASISLPVHCAIPVDMSYADQDWELACDNTRTCRVAGYQSEEADALPVSVLLTRAAGPGTKPTGELMIGHYGNEERKMPTVSQVRMHIDGEAFGPVAINEQTWTGKLSETQVRALLVALEREAAIVWTDAEKQWRLSTAGAAAVLLKMDAFQGRIGTVGALIAKGSEDEASVLPPLAAPVVHAAPVVGSLPGDAQLFKRLAAPLRKELLAVARREDSCDNFGADEPNAPIAIRRLTRDKLLLSASCWRAAYNEGEAFWVANAAAPFHPRLVTGDGTDYERGVISSIQRNRGLGDCIGVRRWVWDGERFVHAETSETGKCRLVAAGGSWFLPTFITEVRRSPAGQKK